MYPSVQGHRGTAIHAWPHRRPLLEALEGRLLFSTYTVTTLGDGAGVVTPVGADKFNATTLRAAMTAANGHAGTDTIKFSAAVTGTINLTAALPQIADDLTLRGPGATMLAVRRSAAATTDFSIFYVNAGKTSTISGLTIAKGTGTPGEYIDAYTTWGGGIWNLGTLALTNSILSGNSAGFQGGGILNNGKLTVTNSTLSGNRANDGAGIFSYAGMLTVTNSTISDNSGGYGSGIENYGTLIVTNSRFSGNSASSGGGIYNQGGGTLTLVNSMLSGNSAIGDFANYGGALLNSGTGIVTNCTLSGNSAGGGGGVANYGTLAVTTSTLLDNSASDGGALSNSGTLTVTNTTVAGNSAGDLGGGIYGDGGTVVTASCTLTANVAVIGGGIYNSPRSTVRSFNSIVAGNRDPFDVPDNIAGAADAASAFNLVGTGKAGGLKSGVNGNRVGVTLGQLKLGPLADNGGPTQTMALLPGSVAINAGSNAKAVGPDVKALATDQRGAGFARIVSGRVDIGAFEVQPAGSVAGIVFKDVNGNRARDAGEPGLKGWVLYADLNRDGKLTAGEPKALSDATGHYQIFGLAAGKYLIRLQPQSGWRQTQPLGGGPHGPTVVAGRQTTAWDFGVAPTVATSPFFETRALASLNAIDKLTV